MASDTRQRLLAAAYACIGRFGISKTTLEDVAREAGLSRATVYRHFPGGRDQLVAEVISWEAGRFFGELAERVSGADGLAELLAETLMFARRAITNHEVLQFVLATEPERLLPQLTVESTRIIAFIRSFLVPHLETAPLRPGLGAPDAADLLARLILSYIGSPGRWDLTDPAQVADLVRRELLGPVCALPQQ